MYYDKIVSLRAELKEELRDKVLMTDEQLDEKCDNEDMEDYFYNLPQTMYHGKYSAHIVYMVALSGSIFKCYDNETGEFHEIDMDWVDLDSLALFLDIEPYES